MELTTRLNVTAKRNARGDYTGTLSLPLANGGSIESHVELPRAMLDAACRYLRSTGGVNGYESVGRFHEELRGCLPAVSGLFGYSDGEEVGDATADIARLRERLSQQIAQGAPIAEVNETKRQIDALIAQGGQVKPQAPPPAPGPDALSILGNVLTGGLSGAIQTATRKDGDFGTALGSILSGGATSLLGAGPGSGKEGTGGPLGGLLPLGGIVNPLGALTGATGGKGAASGPLGALPGIGGLLGGLLGGLPGLPGLPSPGQLLGMAPTLLGAAGLLGQGDALVSSAPQLFGSLASPISTLLRTALRTVDATAGNAVGDPAARQAIVNARKSAERRVAAALRMAEAALAQHS